MCGRIPERLEPFFDIRGYGASGGGSAPDTVAIQRAVDTCAASGGGVVIVPAGRFLTGTIYLKDNVELHLSPGARLVASPNLADYNADDAFPQNSVYRSEQVTGAHLILALGARNASITGRGTIDGNSAAFLLPAAAPGGKSTVVGNGRRPGQMVCFVECRDVRVDGVELLNAPYWTLFFHGCEDVAATGLRIRNPFETPNGDGIDVDCCRNVTISDCRISSGDDCITLRGNSAPLMDRNRCCENVTVVNCILSTPCNAIRVGVGDSKVRRCTVSNIVVHSSLNGICLIGRYSSANAGETGTTIEDVRFSNLLLETVMPFYVSTGRDSAGQIRNISFSNVRATGSKCSFVSGMPGNRLSGVFFRDVEIEIGGGRKTIAPESNWAASWREWQRGRPAALFCAHADGMVLDRVRVGWGACDGPWRSALMTEHCEPEIRDSQLPDPPGAGG